MVGRRGAYQGAFALHLDAGQYTTSTGGDTGGGGGDSADLSLFLLARHGHWRLNRASATGGFGEVDWSWPGRVSTGGRGAAVPHYIYNETGGSFVGPGCQGRTLMLLDAARIAQHLACTLHGVPTCWCNRDGEALGGPGEGVRTTFPTREALGFGVLMGMQA
jgi:hypothetical protein